MTNIINAVEIIMTTLINPIFRLEIVRIMPGITLKRLNLIIISGSNSMLVTRYPARYAVIDSKYPTLR